MEGREKKKKREHILQAQFPLLKILHALVLARQLSHGLYILERHEGK